MSEWNTVAHVLPGFAVILCSPWTEPLSDSPNWWNWYSITERNDLDEVLSSPQRLFSVGGAMAYTSFFLVVKLSFAILKNLIINNPYQYPVRRQTEILSAMSANERSAKSPLFVLRPNKWMINGSMNRLEIINCIICNHFPKVFRWLGLMLLLNSNYDIKALSSLLYIDYSWCHA